MPKLVVKKSASSKMMMKPKAKMQVINHLPKRINSLRQILERLPLRVRRSSQNQIIKPKVDIKKLPTYLRIYRKTVSNLKNREAILSSVSSVYGIGPTIIWTEIADDLAIFTTAESYTNYIGFEAPFDNPRSPKYLAKILSSPSMRMKKGSILIKEASPENTTQFTYETPNGVSPGIPQFTYETPNGVSPGIPQFTYETPNVVSPGIPQFTYETPNVVSPGIPQILVHFCAYRIDENGTLHIFDPSWHSADPGIYSTTAFYDSLDAFGISYRHAEPNRTHHWQSVLPFDDYCQTWTLRWLMDDPSINGGFPLPKTEKDARTQILKYITHFAKMVLSNIPIYMSNLPSYKLEGNNPMIVFNTIIERPQTLKTIL
jgi:hypothetical protein